MYAYSMHTFSFFYVTCYLLVINPHIPYVVGNPDIASPFSIEDVIRPVDAKFGKSKQNHVR